MKDRSLGIWLMVLFGVSGLTVVALSWSLPALRSDRLAATLVGAAGIGVAVVRGLMLRKSPARPTEELVLDIRPEKKEESIA
jgi:hypothetical protein